MYIKFNGDPWIDISIVSHGQIDKSIDIQKKIYKYIKRYTEEDRYIIIPNKFY